MIVDECDLEFTEVCETCEDTGCPCQQWHEELLMANCECGCFACGRTGPKSKEPLGPKIVSHIEPSQLYEPLEWRLAELESMPYLEYLRTPEWKERRRVLISRRDSRCEQCTRTSALHIHHLTYERRGRERDSDLRVLCARCHRKTHGIVV